MKVCIFAYSNKACETAERVAAALESIDEKKCYTTEKYLRSGFSVIGEGCGSPREFYGKCFEECSALISVGSCGIAVRHIAPFVKDKTKDPAVIVIDEMGKYVIPILSGHIGGANRLAIELAQKLGAEAVITTATDINGRFSVDTWAAENGYAIDSMKTAKAVSAEILERDVEIFIEETLMQKSVLAMPGKEKNIELPAGLVLSERGEGNRHKSGIGIYVGYKTSNPFDKTLHLIPKVLSVGLGCRKDMPKEKIADAVSRVFAENDLDMRAIGSIASIDIKKDEKGILGFCEDIGIEPKFFSAAELETVTGEFSPSDFVKSVTGVDNVCERAAKIEADRIIVKKTAFDGVTVAVGLKEIEVAF